MSGIGSKLIEASAGTGKTEALATRLVELLEHGVPPQEIVALTFSRAAAGEIFERFVGKLADAAATDHRSAELLRKTIATQHLSQIGTLDSFLMRIVRVFPLELGLRGRVEILDDERAGSAVARVSFGILRRTDRATREGFLRAFAAAMGGEDVRSFVASYRAFTKAWHALVCAFPDQSSWGDAGRIGSAEAALTAIVATDERARAADALAEVEDSPKFAELVEWVRNFRGSYSDAKGYAKKLLEIPRLLGEGPLEFQFNRKRCVYAGGDAAAIRRAFACLFGESLAGRLRLARGIHGLVSRFEAEYAAQVRNRGKLVFADMPRLVAALDENTRQAVEYRLDSKIGAWALDEFQDTSREQWNALKSLVHEATSGDRSVFIVGDTKQAIYGWRNGDVGIFAQERDSGRYDVTPLQATWRSGPAVVEAVNRVFRNAGINDDFPDWECPEHTTNRPGLGGFVQAFDAAGTDIESFARPVYDAITAVDPVRRGLSAAVLVRSNSFGRRLVDWLKAHNLEGIAWEGESSIADTPALAPFLDLVHLADHPGDLVVYRHFAMTELARLKYPQGLPPPGEISSAMAAAFASRGLVRVLRELRALVAGAAAQDWDAFTEERFTAMLRAAARFEQSSEPDTRLGDFPAFLRSQQRRNVAEPGEIRVMSIHRSKGLGFDYVVLPLYEPKPLVREPDEALVGDGWVLPDPGAVVCRNLPELEQAWRLRRRRVELEAICGYYVALTRAKRAMTIICHPASTTRGAARKFSDYIRNAGIAAVGDPGWYRDPGVAAAGQPQPAPGVVQLGMSAPRERLRRRLPSFELREGQSAAEFFVRAASRRSEAMRRGEQEHARLAMIEFLEPAAVRDEFDRRLIRPAGFIALWRERAYELRRDDVWESGRPDRVVFFADAAGRRAEVVDFKTDHPRRGESVEEFIERMRTMYARQLATYRLAVAQLAALDPSRIATVLLLAAVRRAVEVDVVQ